MLCDDVQWPAHFLGGKSGVPGTAPLVQGKPEQWLFLFQHSTPGALARILQAVTVRLSTHPPAWSGRKEEKGRGERPRQR